MKLTIDDMKRILLKMHRMDVSPADRDLMERIQEAIDNSCEDDIECPHCYGSGRVSEDFLTDEHVSAVFSDYCQIFGIHKAYGVEKWDDWGEYVHIKQDVSCRGCYDYETHKLPKTYFTRNVEKRRELMREGKAEKDGISRAQAKAHDRARIASLRDELAKLEAKQI